MQRHGGRLLRRAAVAVRGAMAARGSVVPSSLHGSVHSPPAAPPMVPPFWQPMALRSLSSTATSSSAQEGRGLPAEYVGKKVAKFSNTPKLALKWEVVDYFEGCGLKAEHITSVIDERLRFQHWRIVFPSDEVYARVMELVGSRKKLGSRQPHLELTPAEDLMAENDPKHPNRMAAGFRGRSLIMLGGPEEATTDVIERFFENYSIAPNAIRHLHVLHEGIRTPLRMRLAGEKRPLVDVVERRTVIKFRSENDCYRAYRELHREFLLNRPIELRLLQ